MSDFWSAPATSGIGYPLLVAAILAVASRLPKVGPPLRARFVRVGTWLWHSRPVTWRRANRQALQVAQSGQSLIAEQDAVVKKQAQGLDAARAFIADQERDHQVEVERLTTEKEQADEHLRLFVVEAEGYKRKAAEADLWRTNVVGLEAQIRDLQSRAAAEVRRVKKAEADQREAQRAVNDRHQADLAEYAEKAEKWEVEAKRLAAELADAQKRSERTAEWQVVDLTPQSPPPRPRWELVFPDDPNEPLGLANFIPRSVTRRVRVDSDRAYLRILDAGYWDEVVGGGDPVTFAVRLTALGRAHGATVFLEWYDEEDEEHHDQLEIEATNPPPPVSWSVETPF